MRGVELYLDAASICSGSRSKQDSPYTCRQAPRQRSPVNTVLVRYGREPTGVAQRYRESTISSTVQARNIPGFCRHKKSKNNLDRTDANHISSKQIETPINYRDGLILISFLYMSSSDGIAKIFHIRELRLGYYIYKNEI